jgi:hypothetical protein
MYSCTLYSTLNMSVHPTHFKVQFLYLLLLLSCLFLSVCCSTSLVSLYLSAPHLRCFLISVCSSSSAYFLSVCYSSSLVYLVIYMFPLFGVFDICLLLLFYVFLFCLLFLFSCIFVICLLVLHGVFNICLLPFRCVPLVCQLILRWYMNLTCPLHPSLLPTHKHKTVLYINIYTTMYNVYLYTISRPLTTSQSLYFPSYYSHRTSCRWAKKSAKKVPTPPSADFVNFPPKHTLNA